MDKTTLITKIVEGKADFDSLITELCEVQKTQPGICGNWSVKDIVAHMVVHEQRMLKWMVELLQGETPNEYQPYDSPDEQLDALNHQIYLENADRSWLDIQQDWENTHKLTLAWIPSVGEDELFDSSKFHLLNKEPLWTAVAANTFEHYEEHGRDIRVWMGKN